MASGTLKKNVIIDLQINDSEAVTNIAELTKHMDELKAKQQLLNRQQQDLGKQLREGTITEEEYAAALQKKYIEIAKNDAELKETKRSLAAYQKELSNNLVKEKAAEGSLDAMRAELANMRKEYEALSEDERNNPLVGEKQQKEIAELTQKIKDLEYAQLDFRRNVGNYPEVGNAKQALKDLTAECVNLAVALSKSEGQIQAQNTQLQMLASTLGTDSQEYQDAAAELQRMNDAYATSTQKLNEMIQEAGTMKDVIGDVNQRINSFANDQQKIAAMQEGVSVLTSAYTVLQGSMAALGIESKSLLEIYARIQIVQQSINSLMTIYKALNKDSNLMIVLRQKLEQARLVWTKAYNEALAKQNAELAANTVAEGANAAATTTVSVAEGVATGATISFSAALQALKAVLLSNPFTAIALAITTVAVAIGGAVKKIVKANKEAKQSEEELAEAAKKNAEVYKNAVDKRINAVNSSSQSYTEQIAKVKALLSVLQSESAAYTAKKKAMDALNSLVPAYNGHLSNTGKIISANSAAIDKFIKDLERQAEATATMNALISAYEDKIEAERRKRQDEENKRYYEKQKKFHEQMKASAQSVGDYETVAQAEKNLEYYSGKLNAVAADLKEVNQQLNDANKEIEYYSTKAKDLSVPPTPSDKSDEKKDKEEDEKTLKEAQETYDEMLQIAKEYYAKLEQMANEAAKTLTEKENLRYKGEREQLQQALGDAQKLYHQLEQDPKLLKELQKKNKNLSLESLLGQIKILNDELDKAAERHNKNLEKIGTDTEEHFNLILKKLRLQLDQSSADLTTQYAAELKSRLDALDEELKRELETYEYTEEQKLAITKLYEEKRAKLISDFASKPSEGDYSNVRSVKKVNEQLKQDLAELEARKTVELAMFEGTEEQKAEIVKKYADLRVKYEKKASQQEARIWMQSVLTIADALATTMGNMSDLFNTLAEDDAKMNQYAKALAMSQIIISAAVATAQAVQAAINFGKDTGLGAAVAIPLALVEFIGIITSTIAQAKQTLSQATSTRPKFAEGGLVGGRVTTKKDDRIDAKLSEGEYVISAPIVKKVGVDFLDYLNFGKLVGRRRKTAYAEGGAVSIPMSAIEKTQTITTEDLRDAMKDAVAEIQPVVSVKEITNKQNRVRVKENLATAR